MRSRKVQTPWARDYLGPILQSEKLRLGEGGSGLSKVIQLVSAGGSVQTPGLSESSLWSPEVI